MSDLKKFIRDEVLNFKEYKTVSSVWDLAEKFGKKEAEIIKLDQGENLFSDSNRISRALGKFKFYNYYPDPEYKKLRQAIGKNLKVSEEKIMVGSGSDELIDLIFRLTLNINDEVINFPPTFGMYDVSLILNRGKIINIPRDENYSIDISKALNAINSKTKIIIVCSPNNPTGNPTPKLDLIKLLKTGKLVLLDEAYAEYAKEDFLDLSEKYPNLIILRTFSKWAGIAGLRLGYVIMNEYLISELMKIKPPFNVSLGAEVAGLEILKNLKSYKKNIDALKKERDRLYKNLQTLPYLKVFSSETNFIFVKYLGKDFETFRNYLNNNQVALRYFVSELTGTSIRITVGQKIINDQLIKVLKGFKNSPKIDSIIFDMDGVLIYVGDSCRAATRLAGNYILKAQGFEQNISKADVDLIKTFPGFNNDWDATYRLISIKQTNNNLSSPKALTVQEKSSKLYDLIKDIWQIFYLGSEVFEKQFKKKAQFIYKKPLRDKEKLLVSKKVLEQLSKKYKLSIATSRPKYDAFYALSQFNLEKYFPKAQVICLEDVEEEKPSPEPLIKAQKRMGTSNPIYVGDTINDYLASEKAKFPFVLIGDEKFGDFQIKSVNNLIGEIA